LTTNFIFSQARADSKAIEKEKLELEEHFACLNEKYSICEQSLCSAQEDISSFELTQCNSSRDSIAKLHLETSFRELSAVRTYFSCLFYTFFIFFLILCVDWKKSVAVSTCHFPLDLNAVSPVSDNCDSETLVNLRLLES
jgi:hypothetical protein